MRILISTKMFVRIVREALDNKAQKVYFSKDRMIVEGKKVKEYSVHTDIKDGEWVCLFNPVTWYEMMQFMKHLQEQPIVIDTDWYSNTKIHEEPTFTLKQFIKSF